MQDHEQLGAFYLGREYDPEARKATENLVLYDSKDLTTHAVCVGMTGSGKTGLCVALLEEAAIDGVPAIAIDPKGDLGNLLLAFPELRAGDFRPWIDEQEAARRGQSADECAAATAERWRQGLAEWGQNPDRIRNLRDKAEFAIYTPGSPAGRPLAILQSLSAPSAAVAADPGAMRDRVLSTVSGLLALLGIEADPVQSREHILLSNLIDRAWREGRSMDLPTLIGSIQNPPFDKVGVFDVESFFPGRDRLGLAMLLNNLLASPGFSAWMEGEPLDVQRLLFTPSGKPRIAVLSIAHLGERERMFFVTLLLNEVLAWARSQSGTSSLRAVLYMDEIFGYFPPTANPPSKLPMLTLLKQARAYGLGVVLATQNPVDLDYKGLSNAGTWFIGRLQTQRDKDRVLEGLESAAGGSFDRGRIDALISDLGNRVFLMRNVHEEETVLFQTRWALTYLRGPLTLPQIRTLCAPAAASSPAPAPAAPAPATAAPAVPAAPAAVPAAPAVAARPAVAPGVPEYFVRPRQPGAAPLLYRPLAAGSSKLHFVDARRAIDAWVVYTHTAPIAEDGRTVLWDQATVLPELADRSDAQPGGGAAFSALPAAVQNPRTCAAWAQSLEDFLYQTVTLAVYVCPELKLASAPGESEGDFRARVAQALREKRDLEVERLRARYAPKLETAQRRLQQAQERVAREKSQYGQQKLQTAISLGATVLGALLGRKAFSSSSVGRATTTLRGAGRIGREKEDVTRAEESVESAQAARDAVQREMEDAVAALQGQIDPRLAPVEKTEIRPRKSDIAVGAVGIAWMPWKRHPDGTLEPLG